MSAILGTSELVIRHLAGAEDRVMQGAAVGLARGLLHAAQVAQREYLSGPRPSRLGIRSRRLRDAVATEVVAPSAGQPNVIGRIGDNMRYAAYHEFGFHGTVKVRSFTRISHVHNRRTGEATDIRRRIVDDQGNFVGFRDTNARAIGRLSKKKFLNTGFNSVTVRAHARKIDYEGRPYIGPALEKSQPIIQAEISAEMQKAIS